MPPSRLKMDGRSDEGKQAESCIKRLLPHRLSTQTDGVLQGAAVAGPLP
jgi:hypothetical protein